jgi:3-oxo-5-alpha-steroid 4-dehydrogenase 1
VILFVTGYRINRWADRVLASLRAPGETGYKIPRGGLYELISCPNYFGELLEWIGFAIAAGSLAGWSFVAFTAANLIPRALSHHRWYRQQILRLPARPQGRPALRAVIRAGTTPASAAASGRSARAPRPAASA